MPSYSVATTKDKLSSLIDKALAGEEVIITRHGKPAVEMRIVQSHVQPKKRGWAYYHAELEKLPAAVNHGKPLMQQIKDEYRY